MKPLCVLTIAGSDSGAGAGIQADARTMQALGGFALAAITAVTAQNTRGVISWRAEPPALIAAQIEAVLNDFSVAAIKTGLLPSAAAVRAVAVAVKRYPRIPLVVDPVIGSTSGTRFLSVNGVEALADQLLPRAAVVTPNWPEAAILSGLSVRDFDGAEKAARAILKTGCAAVLVKGGHARGKQVRDVLVTADGRLRWFEGSRIQTRNTHGTGCVLSAAIAAGLAKGAKVAKAVDAARDFLRRGLEAGKGVRLGSGAGPALF